MAQKPVKFQQKKQSWDRFLGGLKIQKTLDTYFEQLSELFLIRNPRFRFGGDYSQELKEFLAANGQGRPVHQNGSWFYFPWNGLLAHYLPEAMHQELRTARNKNLITLQEQDKFYNFRVGIAGLSVGSHAALTIAMMGGAKNLRLADPDVISGSNLNRIRTDFTQIGEKKCDFVTRQIYQINPYANLTSYDTGVSEKNIGDFLGKPEKLDVLVESLDNLEMKIRLRLAARKMGIPVLMATDNGDGIIFDIERYDLNPKLQLFNGAAGNVDLDFFKKMKPQDLPRLATSIAGPKIVVPKMLQSVTEVGKTLYSWPQLGDAATICGACTAYAVKAIATGKKLASGKYAINPEAIFEADYKTQKKLRQTQAKKTLKLLGIK